MKKKLIKIALIGKTNAGKSTLLNSFVGKKISIINRKINTTKDSIIGIINEPHPNTLALHPADIIGRKILNRELSCCKSRVIRPGSVCASTLSGWY